MGTDEYAATAIARAVKANYTAETVVAMGYRQIAELAGIRLGADGSSPDDFFYVQVRAAVVAHIREVAEAAARKAEEDSLRAFLVLNKSAKDVYRNSDGELVIR